METEEPIEIPSVRRAPRASRSSSPLAAFFRIIRRFFLWVVIIVILIIAVGSYELGRYSVYRQYPQLSQQDEANAILAKVSQLIQLPQNEAPSMATIVDAAAAKSQQPFVANAQNGDVLIVYATSGLAILYRPGTNKLIAVGPVTAEQGAKVSPDSTTPITLPATDTATSSKKKTTPTPTNVSTTTAQ